MLSKDLCRMVRTGVLFVQVLMVMLPCIGAGASPAAVADGRKPVAEVLGTTVYEEELVPAGVSEAQKAKLSPEAYAAWYESARGEKLREIVWSAVFGDFALKGKIEPAPAEIESNIRQARAFRKEDRVRREREREALIAELGSPGITEMRRKQAQQYLDTLNSLRESDARTEQERRDPEREKMWRDSERRVAEVWVKQWKVNQALYREFGGRIIFQQAGWEPIDAYRALLGRYEAKKVFVVHDPKLREAVYSYFKHNFVHADEKKAAFYFEKPYWERSADEMKAAGF